MGRVFKYLLVLILTIGLGLFSINLSARFKITTKKLSDINIKSQPISKKKSPSKQVSLKKPLWETKLGEALQGLELRPILNLRDHRDCQIDIQGEKLLQNLCKSYLEGKTLETSARTIRFAQGLRCIGPYQLMSLDSRLAQYITSLLSLLGVKDPQARQGLACMANAFILVTDSYPNARQGAVRRQFKENGGAIVRAIEQYPNQELGLWCPDHLGSIHNFKRTCRALFKGETRIAGCIEPVTQTIKTYGDEVGLGLGVCSCVDMVLNGGSCVSGLPPCLSEFLKSGLPWQEGPKGPQKGGKVVEGSGGLAKGPTTGDVSFGSEGSPLDFGPNFGNGEGNFGEFLSQFTEQQLMTMGCNQKDLDKAVGGMGPMGRCNFREAMEALSATTPEGRERHRPARCMKEAAEAAQQNWFRVVDSRDAYRDPQCALIDNTEGGEGEAPPETNACDHPDAPPNCPEEMEEARRMFLDPDSGTKTALQLRCASNSMTCSDEQMDEAIREGLHILENNSVYDPEGRTRWSSNTIAQYDYEKRRIEIFAGGMNARSMTHEALHAATDALGFKTWRVVTKDQCSDGNCTTVGCMGNGETQPCLLRNEDHDVLNDINSPYRDIGPDQPGLDTCTANDLANNALFRCLQEVELEEGRLVGGAPIDPIGPSIFPHPDALPQGSPGFEALMACTAAASNEYSAVAAEIRGRGAQPDCMDPDNPACLGHQDLSFVERNVGAEPDRCLFPEDPSCDESCLGEEDYECGLDGCHCQPLPIGPDGGDPQ